MRANEVIITGYGLVAPGAMSASNLFEQICANVSCIREHPGFKALGFPNTAAGFIDDAQWEEIDKSLAADMRQQPRQVALAEFVMRQALQHANLSLDAFSKAVNGLFIGANKYCVTNNDLSNATASINDSGQIDLDDYLEKFLEKNAPFALRVDQQTLHLSRLLKVRNNVATHSDACAAGTIAIGAAYRAIAEGKIDIAVCGATELMANELPYYMFHSLGALCEKSDLPPAQQSRPFMLNRSGFVLGEGAACLVLESEQHAQKRGAIPLGKVLGFYNHCEAQKITSSQRDGNKYAECMSAALQDANLSPADIDHVNTHGTSTQVNDDCEAKALLQLFGSSLNKMTFTANKSAIGHSLAGSGAIEAVLSLESLQRGLALPTLNYQSQEAIYPELRFLSEPLHQPIQYLMSNSFGFGGENSSLVLGKI